MSIHFVLGMVGACYGLVALARGPLRILGAVFLLLNGLSVAGSVMWWIVNK